LRLDAPFAVYLMEEALSKTKIKPWPATSLLHATVGFGGLWYNAADTEAVAKGNKLATFCLMPAPLGGAHENPP
jgi:hypothetical protein